MFQIKLAFDKMILVNLISISASGMESYLSYNLSDCPFVINIQAGHALDCS